MEYGAEIWEDERSWKEAEVVQRKVMRYILKAKKGTTNAAVHGDLGWPTLKTRRQVLKLRYWRKIVTMKDSRLVKCVYNEELKANENNTWSSSVRRLLKKMKLERYWRTQMITKTEDEWNKIVEESISIQKEED